MAGSIPPGPDPSAAGGAGAGPFPWLVLGCSSTTCVPCQTPGLASGCPCGGHGKFIPISLEFIRTRQWPRRNPVPAKTMEGCWDPTRLWTPAPQSLKVPKLACITIRQFGGWKRINRPRSQSQKAHLRRKPRFPELWLKLSDGASIKSEWKSPMSPFCFPSMGKCKLLPSPL